uniref:Putative Polyprenyl synthetase n=1 Tax=uncultured marine microorganism HF4000_APKG7H23 TaxID=455551 RepID=B3T9S5_9ZZZZ|nr:putative Polyprenyl synthetase [uncultured marine microorganism HF4000_APKG7H23]
MVETVDNRIKYIYEPIQAELDRVVEMLRGIAPQAGSSLKQGVLDYAVMSGGKKLRPALTLLSAQFHPHDPTAPIIMATAVELLHIASLVHDDTVDSSTIRRGRATVSSRWGGKVAVMLGDYLFATSATYVCDTGDIRVIRRFSEAIMELARGELSEHFSLHNWDQTVADYEERTYDKTASLFCTASECGAVLSGASESHCQALKAYGYHLGMAFQIMDDILDFQGTEAELGKPVGNDLLQGTITLPALFFAQRYPDESVLERLKKGGTDQEDLRQMVEMVRNSPAIDETLAVADRYGHQALEALGQLAPNQARSSLKELASYITSRRG